MYLIGKATVCDEWKSVNLLEIQTRCAVNFRRENLFRSAMRWYRCKEWEKKWE